jgi:uncharacterized membrane protein
MEQARTTTYRITSIDILRGIVMIIMAIDHTRDFFHESAMTADPLNPATTTAPLYFTRWITHFCAPIFVFLSGISAYLSAQRKSKAEASLFMIKRGLWLILVEVTIVTFGITFDPTFGFIVLQVIWAIGCSMVLLGIVSRFSNTAVLVVGIILFFGHNILDSVSLPATGTAGNLWTVFFRAFFGIIPIDETHVVGVFYAILPWTGAMMMGYSIGRWYKKDFPAESRKKLLLVSGISLIVLFVVLRATNIYGNPLPFKSGDGFMYNLFAFLNTSKYPPSLQYLSMTLGPGCIFLALLENVQTRFSRFVSVYGSVPFFYYILHFYLIHTLLVIIFFATGHTNSEITANPPFFFRPATFGYNLWIMYGIWLFVVLALYFPCRWFSRYKKTHRQWWLSYV